MSGIRGCVVGLVALGIGMGCATTDSAVDAYVGGDSAVTDLESDLVDEPDVADASADGVSDVVAETSGADDQLGDTATDSIEPDVADASADAGSSVMVYSRPESGDPVDATELAEITGLYLELLEKTRYFDVLDERIHGWPQSDEQGRYWYGSWWSGVTIKKEAGAVTYLHSPDGADNNGMRSAPMLDGACFASALWGRDRDRDLVRRIVRGFSSWMMAFDSDSHPEWKGILSRAAYPESIVSTDGGRDYLIDYSFNRPGEPNGATVYVNVPDNPHWGDVWVKNKRSKDDIGHMMQSMALLRACTPSGDGDTDLAADIAQAHELYQGWASDVDADGFAFATVAEDGSVYYPDEDLAYLWLTLGNIECEGALALRLYHSGEPGDLECGDGVSELESVLGLKNDFYQINRSFAEAVVAWGLATEQPDTLVHPLLDGLVFRINQVIDLPTDQDPCIEDRAELLAMSMNAGLPLNWTEVRYLHERIRQAHSAMVESLDTAALMSRYDIFNEAVGDGAWGLEPGSSGLHWRHLGVLLGDCASPYRNPTSKTVLDCDRIRSAGTR